MLKDSNLYLFAILFCFSCVGDLPFECEECGFKCLEGDRKNIGTNNCSWFDDCGFLFYPDSRIDVTKSNGIGPGSNNIFEFKTTLFAIEGIRPEIVKTLIFESDPAIRTFELNGAGFKSLNVHFKQECVCGDVKLTPVEEGCIAGEQQATGIWFIYGKVMVNTPSGEEEMKFEARFDRIAKTSFKAKVQ